MSITLRIAIQLGADTARIDWLCRIPHLKWTNIHSVDRVVAVIGLALIWLAMAAQVSSCSDDVFREDSDLACLV